MTALSPTQSNVTAALGQFLIATLGLTSAQIIVGQQNRVPEPQSSIFVVMTPIRYERLATNVDDWADVKFTGSISGAVLTVSGVAFGTIAAGAVLFGVGVAVSTKILAQTGGAPGGVGTYTVSPSQTVSSETLSAGAKTLLQSAKVTVQLDFHSADQTAGDNAQIISTLLRDEYGTSFFANLAPTLNGVTPFYADDPRQIPFLNDQQQVEWRWVLDAYFEVEEIASVPQQYGDGAVVDLISVEAVYPPV